MSLDIKTLGRILLEAIGYTVLPGVTRATTSLVEEIRKSQSDLDQQVTKAVAAMQNTSALIAQLESGINERSQKLEQLRTEHKRYTELVEIEAQKAAPLLKEVEAALSRNQRRERWVSFWINIAAGLILFILGVVLSDTLKGWLSGLWQGINTLF